MRRSTSISLAVQITGTAIPWSSRWTNTRERPPRRPNRSVVQFPGLLPHSPQLDEQYWQSRPSIRHWTTERWTRAKTFPQPYFWQVVHLRFRVSNWPQNPGGHTRFFFTCRPPTRSHISTEQAAARADHPRAQRAHRRVVQSPLRR
jgi:hypothetical protein